MSCNTAWVLGAELLKWEMDKQNTENICEAALVHYRNSNLEVQWQKHVVEKRLVSNPF